MGTGDSEGPAWNKFWLSLDNDSESVVSDSTRHTPSRNNIGGHHRPSPDIDMVPAVWSVVYLWNALKAVFFSLLTLHPIMVVIPQGLSNDALRFKPSRYSIPFKFKAPSGRIHRVQVAPSGGLGELLGAVVEKLGHEVIQVGGEPTFGPDGKLEEQGFAMSYVDSEGMLFQSPPTGIW